MLPNTLRLIAVVSAAAVVACSPAETPLPPGAHVETLQTMRLVLHGTASARSSPSCNSTPASTPLYLQLPEETSGDIMLRPIRGTAVLHVQELATNRTWCAVTRDDGTGATIEGEFPGGVFAVSVDGARPTPFEVVFERL